MPKLLPRSIVLLAAACPAFSQTYTVLYNFGNGSGAPAAPAGAIAQSRGGAMLSTSANDYGTVQQGKAFRIWPSGSIQVLHAFASKTQPDGGLVLATDGDYYGVTFSGGNSQLGTIFKMSQNGNVTTLHQFTGGTDGENPTQAPIQSEQGDFFGTTEGPPQGTSGTVYRITSGGNFTVLHTFAGPDGAQPMRQLVQGADGYFYGITWKGGASHDGTIFRISSTGNFKVMVSFNGTSGSHPVGLMQANDGNFYGVTFDGGAGYGVLFRMTPGGALTVLHNFTGGNDGANPEAGLVQGSDGNLYGTNSSFGTGNSGVLFRATLAGNVVPLHNFSTASGCNPWSELLQHTNGKFYGDTAACGKFDAGTFYRLDAGLKPFVTYLPVYGRPGAMVEILGQGFTSSSKVYFNGKQATNVIDVYPTYIRAAVPQGATSGPITVTTSTGTLKSNKVFIVHK